jgi:hypothetical protein
MDEIKAARINASCATAMIRAMGMQAENQQRERQGLALAYDEEAFIRVINEEGIGWNDVHKVLYQ